MTQNIEERTLAATATMEGAAKAVDEIANTDKDVSTPVGSRKSFPKISREWDDESQRLQTQWQNDSATLRQDWQNERNELSTKALGVKLWESGVSETNINQQRRWDDGHTYLPKTVPAVMDINGPNDDWIPYTADKSDTLNDVFGRKPVDLISGVVLVPDSDGNYPKVGAFGSFWELEDGTQQLIVDSFYETTDGYLVLTLDDASAFIATKVFSASKNWVKGQTTYKSPFIAKISLGVDKAIANGVVNMIGMGVLNKNARNESEYRSNSDGWNSISKELSDAGGGSVLLDEPCDIINYSHIFLRDNVEYKGLGMSTIVRNINPEPHFDSTFAIGSYDLNSFVTGAPNRRIMPVSRYQDYIELIDPFIDLKKGDIIYIRSDDGYEQSVDRAIRPVYQQITEVHSVEGNIVKINDAIYQNYSDVLYVNKSGESESALHGEKSEIVKYGSVRNLAAYSEYANLTRFGGGYNVDLENIYCLKSRGAIVLNGLAHSRIKGLKGAFERGAIELAYFSHNTQVHDFEMKSLRSGIVSNFSVITFNEGAHDCDVINPNAFLGGEVTSRRLVRFGEGSLNNTVKGGTLKAGAVESVMVLTNNHANMYYGGNMISDSVISVGNCAQSAFNFGGTEENGGLTVKDSQISVAQSQNLLAMSNGMNKFIRNQVKTENIPNINVNNDDNEIRENRFNKQYTKSGNGKPLANGNKIESKRSFYAAGFDIDEVETTSLSYVEVGKFSIKKGSMSKRDKIRFTCFGKFLNGTGSGTVLFSANGNNLISANSMTGQEGEFSFNGYISVLGTNLDTIRAYVSSDGVMNDAHRSSVSIDTTLEDLEISVSIKTTSESSKLILETISFVPDPVDYWE